MINLGPSWGGATQPQSWAPPQGLRQLPVLGGRQCREEDGSGLRFFLGVTKSPLGSHLLRSPDFGPRIPRAAGREEGGCSKLLHSRSAPAAGAGRRRSRVLFRAPGVPEHTPSSTPGRGACAQVGLWDDLGSARTSSQVVGPDQAQRGAAGAPALCAPAPAAQLLRMTSSHLPPPGPHLPAGWRRG